MDKILTSTRATLWLRGIHFIFLTMLFSASNRSYAEDEHSVPHESTRPKIASPNPPLANVDAKSLSQTAISEHTVEVVNRLGQLLHSQFPVERENALEGLHQQISRMNKLDASMGDPELLGARTIAFEDLLQIKTLACDLLADFRISPEFIYMRSKY